MKNNPYMTCITKRASTSGYPWPLLLANIKATFPAHILVWAFCGNRYLLPTLSAFGNSVQIPELYMHFVCPPSPHSRHGKRPSMHTLEARCIVYAMFRQHTHTHAHTHVHAHVYMYTTCSCVHTHWFITDMSCTTYTESLHSGDTHTHTHVQTHTHTIGLYTHVCICTILHVHVHVYAHVCCTRIQCIYHRRRNNLQWVWL